MKVLHAGYGAAIPLSRVVAILNYNTAPAKKLRDDTLERRPLKLINATYGRKARSLIITDSNHVIMSAIHPETLGERVAG